MYLINNWKLLIETFKFTFTVIEFIRITNKDSAIQILYNKILLRR